MLINDTALISNVDDIIGSMVDQLKASGQYDNTLIVFSSDVSSFEFNIFLDLLYYNNKYILIMLLNKYLY